MASIVEFSEDAIIGKSPEGVIRSWNAGAERLYGYRASEVVGQLIFSLSRRSVWRKLRASSIGSSRVRGLSTTRR